MNDSAPRCAGPGTACRLVQLETPGPRPVWAILDAAGMRRFTGELTLHCQPEVRAYFNDGEVYFAERDGDPSVGERLLEYGVVTPEQLAAGSVQLGAVTHLGRLFDRVPDLDRDPVEVVLELVTGEVLGEIADHTADDVSIASYRHHSSGVWKWRRGAAPAASAPDTDEMPITAQVAVTAPAPVVLLAPPVLSAPSHRETPSNRLDPSQPQFADDDLEPTESDLELVAEYEQMMAEQALADETDAIDAAPIDEPIVELAELAALALEPPATYEPTRENAPFSFDFDLNKVLAQVAAENDGIPMAADSDDVDDDVRAAVRAALAEIEAATRPPVTHGLSPAAFEIALGTAPDSAADIEPAGGPAPWLPSTVRPTPQADAADDAPAEDTTSEPATAPVELPSTGLRRLIAPRKP